MLPLRSIGRSNFDKGRHNSNNYVDSKSTYNYKNFFTIYIYIYIYIIYIYILCVGIEKNIKIITI